MRQKPLFYRQYNFYTIPKYLVSYLKYVNINFKNKKDDRSKV